MCRWWRPVGQHRKRLLTGTTDASANPDLLMPLVVRLFEPLSVADNRPLAAKRAQSREQFQRDLGHPGSVLLSGSGSATKRIKACVKARRRPSFRARFRCLAFTLLASQYRTKKEYCVLIASARPSTCKIGRYIRSYRGSVRVPRNPFRNSQGWTITGVCRSSYPQQGRLQNSCTDDDPTSGSGCPGQWRATWRTRRAVWRMSA